MLLLFVCPTPIMRTPSAHTMKILCDSLAVIVHLSSYCHALAHPSQHTRTLLRTTMRASTPYTSTALRTCWSQPQKLPCACSYSCPLQHTYTQDNNARINSIDFHRTEDMLVTASDDDSIHIYNTGKPCLCLSLPYHQSMGVHDLKRRAHEVPLFVMLTSGDIIK